MKPWSACQGLTGLMVRSPHASYLIDKDVSLKSQDYYSPEWWSFPARSEMVIPIRAGGLLFGLIDVQSRTPGDFSAEDADALTAIALPLAAEFQARAIDNLYRSDRELWEELSRLEDEEQIFRCFGETISRLAGVDVGIYFPLAIGTAYPSQQPYHFGHLREPGKIAEVGRVSPVVTERVARGAIEFVSEAQDNASLQKFNVKREPFVLRENIYSMCFVPISMGDMRLAGMFLNYHAHESFGALRRLSISILTQTLTHHISRIRYKDPIYKRLSQPRFHLHRIFNMSGLTKARLDADFQSLAQNAPEIKDQLAGLRDRILEGIKQAYFEGSLMDMDFEHEELKTRLESFTWSMRHENSIARPELRIVPFIDEKIEQESGDIKVILMAMTMEGIFNAIKHSQADFIEIHIERRPYDIHFSILNDIKTARLPDPETFMSKPHGIIEIMRDVRKALFAPEEQWIVDAEKRTLKLVFDIPAFSPEVENGV
jgi:hypothetical protein